MQPARTNCSRNEQPTTAYRKVMCVYSKFVHSLLVRCSLWFLIGDISLGISWAPQSYYRYDGIDGIGDIVNSLFISLFYFFFTLKCEFIPYNTRSNTICCNLYVSIFHLCPKHMECHRRRIQIESSGTICTAKMMEKKREKICMQIGDLHFVWGPLAPAFFFRLPFFYYIFRLLTLNCCYIHFLVYMYLYGISFLFCMANFPSSFHPCRLPSSLSQFSICLTFSMLRAFFCSAFLVVWVNRKIKKRQ